MKCNKTPVGPLQLLFLMEAFSTLAELIRIIVDKKLYLVSISWPPEDIKSTPPPVLPVMMDQVDLTPVELHPTWLPSIHKYRGTPLVVSICGTLRMSFANICSTLKISFAKNYATLKMFFLQRMV